MDTLNLPKTALKIEKSGEKTQIYDILRHRFVALTPEEWVRQHFIHFLIEHKGYPAALLGNEITIRLNKLSKRCDSVLYDTHAMPRMIIEYKAPHIPLTQKVFDQICRYNMVLHVDYLIVSNGIQHVCAQMEYETGGYRFLNDIPQYSDL